MNCLNFEAVRPLIDLDGKYVDFGLLRTALTVGKVTADLQVILAPPTAEGETRGTCPKCGKERAFTVNLNTNRFNCFNKGCFLKGGGVIDLVAKLLEVTAKEASHLLACAYGIQPYSPPEAEETKVQAAVTFKAENAESPVLANEKGEFVTRQEFAEYQAKLERLTTLVWSIMLEKGEFDENDSFFDDEVQTDEELETVLAGLS